MRATVTLLEKHYSHLRNLLFPPTGVEHVALLLFGRSSQRDPWTRENEDRLLCREVVDIEPHHIISASPVEVTYSTAPILAAAKTAAPKGFGIGVIHSHRADVSFSPKDDVSDVEALAIPFGRNPDRRPHVSLVMLPDGSIHARAYTDDLKPSSVDTVRVIGSRYRFFRNSPHGVVSHIEPTFDRQVRVFGSAVSATLRNLRISIVGCGGTGSAVAALLARIGIGRLALIDDDIVEETNLNRLHFTSQSDADAGRLKVDVVGDGIAQLGLGVQVRRYPYVVNDARCRDALKASDVIFGCTDDHLGRNLLNRLSYFYSIPVIDLGLLIEPSNDFSTYDVFDGRVTVVQPGHVCQVCRGLISPTRMLAEGLRRDSPAMFDQQRRAGYIPALDEPSPVVCTFTTEVASMAVNELLHRVTGFRGSHGGASERVRRFDVPKDSDTIPGGKRRDLCPLCSDRFTNLGDVVPFLDQA
jgi:hypothetical protein